MGLLREARQDDFVAVDCLLEALHPGQEPTMRARVGALLLLQAFSHIEDLAKAFGS